MHDLLFSILHSLSSALYPLSSILRLDPQSSKPAARFELASTAYETVALPIELRRHCSACCQLAPQVLRFSIHKLAAWRTKVVGEGIEPSTSGL